MTTVFDVPAKDLIDALSKKLQKDKEITPPDWSKFVKTGLPSENPPIDKDWWYTRSASILRKIYINHNIGIERLRDEYSQRQNRGSKPHKARKGGGSIVRKSLQQLEKAGYVSKIKGQGRVLTAKGRSFLDNTANEIMKQLIEYSPELKKY